MGNQNQKLQGKNFHLAGKKLRIQPPSFKSSPIIAAAQTCAVVNLPCLFCIHQSSKPVVHGLFLQVRLQLGQSISNPIA
jgi:Co/Zn/Cd efflux system component